MFSEDVVGAAMSSYSAHRSKFGLGEPAKILTHEQYGRLFGIGYSWERDGQEPFRNAFAFRNPDDAEEFRRRITENP